jgi:hypothetical protein
MNSDKVFELERKFRKDNITPDIEKLKQICEAANLKITTAFKTELGSIYVTIEGKGSLRWKRDNEYNHLESLTSSIVFILENQKQAFMEALIDEDRPSWSFEVSVEPQIGAIPFELGIEGYRTRDMEQITLKGNILSYEPIFDRKHWNPTFHIGHKITEIL